MNSNKRQELHAVWQRTNRTERRTPNVLYLTRERVPLFRNVRRDLQARWTIFGVVRGGVQRCTPVLKARGGVEGRRGEPREGVRPFPISVAAFLPQPWKRKDTRQLHAPGGGYELHRFSDGWLEN